MGSGGRAHHVPGGGPALRDHLHGGFGYRAARLPDHDGRPAQTGAISTLRPPHQPIPQVDMASFINGVRVIFPEGLVELGDNLLVYYGAADVSVGGARVNKRALIEGIKSEIALGHTATPL